MPPIKGTREELMLLRCADLLKVKSTDIVPMRIIPGSSHKLLSRASGVICIARENARGGVDLRTKRQLIPVEVIMDPIGPMGITPIECLDSSQECYIDVVCAFKDENRNLYDIEDGPYGIHRAPA